MAVAVVFGGLQDFVAAKRRIRHRATGQHGVQGGAGGLQLGQAAAQDGMTQNGGRGLAQGAGFDVLGKGGDTAILDDDINGDGRPTERRAFLGGAGGGGQAAEVGNIGGERQNPAGIEFDEVGVGHGNPVIPPLDRPAKARSQGAIMTFDPQSLKYDAQGLIPCVAQDHDSGEVLMLAWMTAEAVARTLATGLVTYWSRSRGAFWVKGDVSGHHQHLVELRIDCDRDGLLARVRQIGPACHTNRRSCYYTAIRDGAEVEIMAPMTVA